MQRETIRTMLRIAVLALTLGAPAFAQEPKRVPPPFATPDTVKTQLGTFEFLDGTPSPTTVQKIYDNLDFTHSLDVFLNTFQGASMCALRQGLGNVGVLENQILIFSELMDSNSLFLTANADTIYFMGFIDLAKGPAVLEVPPKVLGTIDDVWWRWVIDFGVAGPDRGEGGKYLLLPPGYDGTLPEGGFFIGRARTNRVCVLGRAFVEKDDPKPTAELIKKSARIYRYEPDGFGTSVAELLTGKYRSRHAPPAHPTSFVEGTGKKINTLPPNDYSFFEMVNSVVQQEPTDALSPELMGQLAAIGIVKGKWFKPDERMKKILAEAAAVGNATARSLFWNPRDAEGFAYYPKSAWNAPLWVGGYDFMTPPPLQTLLGPRPLPTTGARTLNARTSFFYAATGVSPAMCMRIPGIGSQYLLATLDSEKNYFDGGKTYKLTLPKGIPQAKFWSVTVYDNQTRSMLQTPQRYPKVGSLNYPKPAAAANEDGSTTVFFGPRVPRGKDSNWIQTLPDKGWFAILRLYGPLEPFFKKTWRPSEIELVK